MVAVWAVGLFCSVSVWSVLVGFMLEDILEDLAWGCCPGSLWSPGRCYSCSDNCCMGLSCCGISGCNSWEWDVAVVAGDAVLLCWFFV